MNLTPDEQSLAVGVHDLAFGTANHHAVEQAAMRDHGLGGIEQVIVEEIDERPELEIVTLVGGGGEEEQITGVALQGFHEAIVLGGLLFFAVTDIELTSAEFVPGRSGFFEALDGERLEAPPHAALEHNVGDAIGARFGETEHLADAQFVAAGNANAVVGRDFDRIYRINRIIHAISGQILPVKVSFLAGLAADSRI